jgi:hypothetical protein
MECIYRTNFELTNEVDDFVAAKEYLIEDNMVDYLKNDDRIAKNTRDAIENIEWILVSASFGFVKLTANRNLSVEELLCISKFVAGQNSDGLGEGFEQQDFANYRVYDECSDDDEDEYEYVTASFDWENNEYIFKLIDTK